MKKGIFVVRIEIKNENLGSIEFTNEVFCLLYFSYRNYNAVLFNDSITVITEERPVESG